MSSWRRIALMLALASTLGSVVLAEENLLANPGFEEGRVGEPPRGWQAHGGRPPKLDRQWVTDAHSGGHALLIIDQVGGKRESESIAGSGIKQKVMARSGKWYLAACWAKCLQRDRDGAAWLQVRFHPSQERFNVHLDKSGPGGDWEHYRVAGLAPEGTTHVEVYIKTLHLATSRYLVDDLSLEVLARGDNDQRIALLPFGSMGIDEVHELSLHTPIVANRQPAARICVPMQRRWQKVGERLAAELRRLSGVRLSLAAPGWEALRSSETTIAIGNINNNFVVERMWLNRYQEVNALRPGPGEYILQTIPEPYDCPKGKNVLLIGASDAAGAQRGVEALLQRLGKGPDISLDEWILEVSNGPKLNETQREELLNWPLGKYWLREFWQAAQRYQITGDLAHAERAKQVLLACARRYRDYALDPDLLKYWPDPTASSTHRIYWPEETSSEWIGAMWDFIEECPAFNDEERWIGANAMLSALHDLPRHVYYWATLASPETTEPVAFNHTTFPLLGIYFLARYFDRYYGDVDARIHDYLNRVHNCFRAQMKSWKPQEDATGYLSIVPRHTIVYSLAEGDYSYFESGVVKTLCDYTVGFCDNTGDSASFGDNGYGRGVYTRDLEWAVWYYDDAHMLWWLQHVTGQQGTPWQNPYDAKIKPQPWDDLVGATAFRLTSAVYDYTKRRKYGPLNVPLEKAFDKISFRENLEPEGQFFLLDGYSRGGHLHYDANAITKFYADGEDWLIDGDYLVRNTTDHNMLSLTKDGRCAEYEPPCAALEHLADLPTGAMAQTAVYDYNSANWTRNILWLRGELVCVIDRVAAAEPGHFKCECIWKLLNRGELGGDGRRSFSLTRIAGGTPGRYDLTVVKSPAPGVEAAVKFNGRDSRLDFPIELAPGAYSVSTHGYGLNSGADSFWVTVDGARPVAFHLPLETFGGSYDSGVNPKQGPTPTLDIKGRRTHVVTITPREAPGVMLDRVEFRTLDGKLAAAVEAESAPDLPEGLLKQTPAKVFHIKGDGHSRLQFSTRFNHSRLPILYLHQKFGERLSRGQAISNQAVFYNTDEDEAENYEISRLCTDAALLLDDGRPLGAFGVGASALRLPEELSTDAALAFLGRHRLMLCDVTRFGALLTASDPVDIELSLSAGTCVVAAERPVRLELEGRREKIDGSATLRISRDAARRIARACRRKLDELATATQPARLAEGAERRAEDLARAWAVAPIHQGEQPQAVLEVIPADLDGDGTDEILAIRGRYLTCIDADGTVLWEFDGTDELYAACAWDIDGDGESEVFCGGKSKHLYVLDADGSLRHDHAIQTYYRVSRTTIHEPRLDDVLVRDFDGDGDWEAVLGTVDGFTQLIDHNFEQQWIDGETNHGTTEFQVIDLEGDGIEEVAVGNRYGKLRIYRITDGKLVASLNSELGDVQLAVADIDGDGSQEMLNGSATGAFKCKRCNGDDLWQFPNYGYAVRDIKVADLVPGAGLEIAVASDTEFVYLLGPDGTSLAHKDLGSAVLDLAVLEASDASLLVAACRDGGVHVLDGSLAVRGQHSLAAPVNSAAVVRSGRARLIVAGTADGQVTALRLRG